MAEKKFYLESRHELQRIGMRAQVVSFLISQGIKRGNVVNDLEHKNRVIVALATEKDGQIEEIREQLVKYLNGLKGADEDCYRHFPADVRASELTGLDNPHAVILLELNDLASSLMLEQTSKGVGAMLGLPEKLEKAFSNAMAPLTAAITDLTRTLANK